MAVEVPAAAATAVVEAVSVVVGLVEFVEGAGKGGGMMGWKVGKGTGFKKF